jgi:hypothetical protein
MGRVRIKTSFPDVILDEKMADLKCTTLQNCTTAMGNSTQKMKGANLTKKKNWGLGGPDWLPRAANVSRKADVLLVSRLQLDCLQTGAVRLAQ